MPSRRSRTCGPNCGPPETGSSASHRSGGGSECRLRPEPPSPERAVNRRVVGSSPTRGVTHRPFRAKFSDMRATVMYGAGDVRVETVPDARLIEPTDALVSVTRSAICGSDLWPYKSMEPSEDRPTHGTRVHRRRRGRRRRRPHGEGRRPRRHAVRLVRRHLRLLPGRTAHLVSPRRRYGGDDVDGGQGEAVRVPQADGTLVVLPVGRTTL